MQTLELGTYPLDEFKNIAGDLSDYFYEMRENLVSIFQYKKRSVPYFMVLVKEKYGSNPYFPDESLAFEIFTLLYRNDCSQNLFEETIKNLKRKITIEQYREYLFLFRRYRLTKGKNLQALTPHTEDLFRKLYY